ncbi:MAG: DUF4832 domain-containing protein [Chloroflexota bacterium]
MRRNIFITLLISLLAASCLPQQTETHQPPPTPGSVSQTFPPPTTDAPTPNLVTIHFTPSTADIPNPERGFHKSFGLDETSLDWRVEQGYTLAYTDAGNLDAYRNRDLPPEYLNALPAHFQLARDAGIKLIVRFSYNDGPSYPNTEPDARLEQVLRHIEQLAPVLEANKDVIAWFEAGFIGAWGEWHSSTNGLDTPDNKIAIRDALMQYFPSDRFILFRYPNDFTAWYPQPLTEAQAFTQTDQARTGHHNDCFLATNYDGATYLLQPDYEKVMFDEWQAYISQMTRFVPMSGETCEPNPPRTDCDFALFEMRQMHWSALNEAWHPDVIQGWKDQGCYEEIRNHLGYRLTLLQAQYPPIVRLGKNLTLIVNIQNTGFAAPILPRAVYLILAGEQRVKSFLISAQDTHRWEPGGHSIVATISIPADLSPGIYQLALWLPDPAPNLQNDPRYAIRFANRNVWDAEHGWNVLGSLTVQE